jgi:1-acyl-sn-glycerol-3-phosphate acyltransferase
MKKYLFNTIFYAVVLPVTFIISSLVIIMGLFPPKPYVSRIKNHLETFWAKTIMAMSGANIWVESTELDPESQYIFMVNHQSQLDIPLLGTILSHYHPVFVAKHSLFKIPFFGKAMLRRGHIPIDRENRRQAMQSIEKAVQAAQKGTSIVIFPEGTRNTEELADFRIGGIILALKTQLPVVPVLVQGTGYISPKGTCCITPGEIVVRILPPLTLKGQYSLKDRERLKDDLWSLMQHHYLETKQWLNEKTR